MSQENNWFCALCNKVQIDKETKFPESERYQEDGTKLRFCSVCVKGLPRPRYNIHTNRQAGNQRVDIFENELFRIFKTFGMRIAGTGLHIADFDVEDNEAEYEAMNIKIVGEPASFTSNILDKDGKPCVEFYRE